METSVGSSTPQGPSVKKCVALRGKNDRDLERRLRTMREAIEIRGGRVLHVAFRETAHARHAAPGPSVAVLYQVPLWGAVDEDLSASVQGPN